MRTLDAAIVRSFRAKPIKAPAWALPVWKLVVLGIYLTRAPILAYAPTHLGLGKAQVYLCPKGPTISSLTAHMPKAVPSWVIYVPSALSCPQAQYGPTGEAPPVGIYPMELSLRVKAGPLPG